MSALTMKEGDYGNGQERLAQHGLLTRATQQARWALTNFGPNGPTTKSQKISGIFRALRCFIGIHKKLVTIIIPGSTRATSSKSQSQLHLSYIHQGPLSLPYRDPSLLSHSVLSHVRKSLL